MKNKKRAPAMTDVAKLAQVSYQTVSRVLNNPELVAETTRLRVEQVIKELNYRPNHAARMLKTNQSRMLGVLASDSNQFGPNSTLNAIYQAAQAAGYAVQIGLISTKSAESPAQVMRSLIGFGVEGIIVITTQTWVKDALDELPRSVPAVVVAADITIDKQISIVSIVQFDGAVRAVEHLLAQGCQTINHLAGPQTWYDGKARLAGWKHALSKQPAKRGSWQEGNWQEATGYRYIAELYPQLPDGLFVGNDQMALGVLRFFWEKGVSVPADIALVGFDDIESASFSCPALTTIRQPFRKLGREIVRQLCLSIEGQKPQTVSISPDLVIRESSLRATQS